MKIKWLDRSMIEGPYLCLIKTEEEYKQLHKHVNLAYPSVPFPSPGCAVTIQLEQGEKIMEVVVMGDMRGRDLDAVRSVLAHEACHVVDDFFEWIKEKHPSSEFKAYSLQSTLNKLLTDWKRKRV